MLPILLALVLVSVGLFYSFCVERSPQKLNIEALMNKAIQTFHLAPKGIIHLGANTGQEDSIYKKHKVSDVLWVEADPDLAKELQKKFTGRESNTKVACFAASDRSGTSDFMRTSNGGGSSSLFRFKKHSELFPKVKPVDTIKVKLQKLDDYLEETKNTTPYNAMVIDIQGAELLALKGSVNTLKKIDFIVIEVEYEELYEGSVHLSELDTFLLQHGFLRVDTLSMGPGYGDALYVKNNVLQEKNKRSQEKKP